MRLRTAIDVGSALDLVGGVLKWLAPAFLLPALVAVGYGEPFWSFLVAGAITAVAGHTLDQITGEKHGAAVTPRESFLVVALIWLLVPIFGMLPFILDGGPQLLGRELRTEHHAGRHGPTVPDPRRSPARTSVRPC